MEAQQSIVDRTKFQNIKMLQKEEGSSKVDCSDVQKIKKLQKQQWQQWQDEVLSEGKNQQQETENTNDNN